MDSSILDPLPFHVDLQRLLGTAHATGRSQVETEIRRLLAEAESIARPKAIYRVGYVEAKGHDHVIINGVQLTSRVLRVNLDAVGRVFIYVCTAGTELEAWAHAQPDLLGRFYADAVNEAVLYAANAAFREFLQEHYQVGAMSAMNPGSLGDWPLREQQAVFDILGDTRAAVGVQLTPSMLMVPAKTVSGLLFTTEESFASCQLCSREACPNRRAPFDPDLFERKYKERV